jgi:hypothetical protein
LDVSRQSPGALVLPVEACFALELARSAPGPSQDEDFRREFSAAAQQLVQVPELRLAPA